MPFDYLRSHFVTYLCTTWVLYLLSFSQSIGGGRPFTIDSFLISKISVLFFLVFCFSTLVFSIVDGGICAKFTASFVNEKPRTKLPFI